MVSSDLNNLIRCFSLIDITKTDVVQRYKNDLHFIDSAGQDVTTEEEFNHSRNQQRNYETLLQVISLRAQPIYTEKPTCLMSTDLSNYKFGAQFENSANLWEFTFGVEHEGVFDSDRLFGALEDDVNKVPIIGELNESILLPVSIFSTVGDLKNIYFVQVG